MALNTFPFDAAEYLTDPEDQTDLLNEALASGDANVVANALSIVARARNMALSGDGESAPLLATTLGLMRALGVTLKAQIKPAA
ncbi:helix-turn-helix domain-containing transcriptional regulator [Magnetospirillum molischianum]|nr:hypothetical protein [Magnetospirillum molischianum]